MSMANDPLFVAIVQSSQHPDRAMRDRYRPFAVAPEVVERQPSQISAIGRAAVRAYQALSIARQPRFFRPPVFPRRGRLVEPACREPACCC